jgi:hypothetical protein
VVNLRETKRQMAASKRAHPAGKAVAAKAPAKKGRELAATANSPKIAWKLSGEKDAQGDAEGTGTCGDRTYAISRSDDGWKATVKQGTKTTVLVADAKSGRAAWQRCVAHNRSAA